VGNLIPHGELLRRNNRRGAEGTSGKVAPGRSAGWLHLFQYAPAPAHVLTQAPADADQPTVGTAVLTRGGDDRVRDLVRGNVRFTAPDLGG
jgi:hypothetical protein